jgi:hypothetical protein
MDSRRFMLAFQTREGIVTKLGYWKGSAMSALGQKQTFAMQTVMSALPPKADICGASRWRWCQYLLLINHARRRRALRR